MPGGPGGTEREARGVCLHGGPAWGNGARRNPPALMLNPDEIRVSGCAMLELRKEGIRAVNPMISRDRGVSIADLV